jgi:hypothetical protein
VPSSSTFFDVLAGKVSAFSFDIVNDSIVQSLRQVGDDIADGVNQTANYFDELGNEISENVSLATDAVLDTIGDAGKILAGLSIGGLLLYGLGSYLLLRVVK